MKVQVVLYMAGILYPQKTLIENIDENIEVEENENLDNRNF